MRDQLGFENLYRPPTEQWAALCWLVGASFFAIGSIVGAFAWGFVWPLFTCCVAMTAYRIRAAWQLWSRRYLLSARYFDTVSLSQLQEWVSRNPQHVYLGRGFNWEPTHTHRLKQVLSLDREALAVPAAWRALLRQTATPTNPGQIADPDPKGSTAIHGVRDEERVVSLSLAAQSAQNVVLGTTGAGKTVFLNLVASQAVFRGDTVVVLDPKKSKAIPQTLRAAAARVGRPFVYFDLGRPEQSDAIDMLADYTRVSQLATRVTAQMATQDNFAGFFWMVLYRLAEGMDYIGDKPTLVRLRRYAEMGSDALLEKVIEKWLRTRFKEGLESRLRSAEENLPSGKRKDDAISSRLRAMLSLYEGEVKAGNDLLEINGLVAQVLHNAEHMGKMLASGMPTLTKLTVKPLDDLLSPDPTKFSGDRRIWTFENMVRERAIVYIGLGALADAEISSIVGAMCLANLCAVAATMYDFPEQYPTEQRRSVCVMVDEAAELINPEYIQILNKGREAGVYSWFFLQTIPDLAARLGSTAAAYKALGNANNRFALRVLDPESQKFVSDMFGKGEARSLEVGRNLTIGTEDNVAHFRGGITTKVKVATGENIAPSLTGEVPNLELFAHMQAGEKLKLRIPIVTV